MYKATYTTKQTAIRNGADVQAFAEMMNDYEKRINVKADYIEIIDIESGEVVDYANWINVTVNGEKYGEIATCEMINTYVIDGEWMDDDEGGNLEINGYPLHVKRAMRN